jgi:hypothetical protein
MLKIATDYRLGFDSWQGPTQYSGYQGLFCVNANQVDADSSCFTLIADVTNEIGICHRSEPLVDYQH